jgi:DmsE family decaheme c-type cytochrome
MDSLLVPARQGSWWTLTFILLLLAGVTPVTARGQAKPGAPASNVTPNAQNPTQGSTYVGADVCKTCHEEVYNKSFIHTPHVGLIRQGKHGCEDCHGPGSAHVEHGGDVNWIIRFKQLSVVDASARCLSCHQASTETSNFSRSVHTAAGIGCLDCHSPHHATEGPSLLVRSQLGLCYGCHAQQRAEFARPYRHRVDIGLIQCSDCHNPHGSFVRTQLRTDAAGFDVCVKCHQEKAGPFSFEHMPVKQEGCVSCHTPHGSTNPRLLRVSQVNLLCLQCHTAIANRPIPEPPGFHTQSTKYQACTMCHTQIHGSNFNEFFFK